MDKKEILVDEFVRCASCKNIIPEYNGVKTSKGSIIEIFSNEIQGHMFYYITLVYGKDRTYELTKVEYDKLINLYNKCFNVYFCE